MEEYLLELIKKEGTFSFSRSPGPGGQNVNKVNTNVTLVFEIDTSSLEEELKARLKTILPSRVQVRCHQTRSQERNKNIAIEKLVAKLLDALIEDVPRKKTKTPKKEKEKRLKEKHYKSAKKRLRKAPSPDED